MNARATVCLLLLGSLAGLSPPRAAGGEPDLGAIRRLLQDERPSARAAALRRLAGQDDAGSRRILLEGLADSHPYVRRAAAGVLGTGDPADRRGLRRALDRLPEPVARIAACRVLALWADEVGRRALLDRLGDRDAAVRAAAVRWLADDEDEAVGPALTERLEDREGEVRALAIDALVARGAGDLPFEAFLRDRDPRVRLSAVEGSVVGTSNLPGGGRATVVLLHGLTDAVWSVRFLAAELSRRVPDARLLPALVRALADERRRVAEAAHGSLVALTGIPFDPDPAVWTHWLETDGVDFDPAGRAEQGGASPPPVTGGATVARPRFLGLEVGSRHVAFVLDGSGSMARHLPDGRTRWEEACAALADVLGRLDGAHGNVYVFRDAVEAAFDEPVRLTRRRREAIAAWLAGLRPGGRTALFDGIAAALADPATDTVVVLSDGAPSAGRFFTKTDILNELERLNRWHRARIDVISVGTDGLARRWQTALRRLAEDSGGTWLQR